MNTTDYIIICFILISAVHGWYIGLVLSFFNVAGYLIAGIISKLYYTKVSVLIATYTQFDENLKEFIEEKLRQQIGNVTADNMPDTSGLVKELPIGIKDKLLELLPTGSYSPFNTGILNIANALVDMIMNLVGMVVVFLVVLIIIKIIVLILNRLAKLPGLKDINKGGGLLFGTIKGIIIVLIILTIATPFIAANPNQVISSNILDSRVGSWLFDHNILWLFIKDYILTSLKIG